MSKKKRVLVAMSGGIDSTVAAVMLYEQGYEVIGMTMKTWSYSNVGGNKKETGCCTLDSINDARAIAVQIGFPHFIIDIRKEFGQHVINNFKSEYLAGRTPNPCVLCNTHIKWTALLERADKLQCDYIATGHYANVRKHDNGRFVVSKGKDHLKDQSYALWGIAQKNLKRTIFPLGNITKNEIRSFAQKKGFFDLLSKPESYEICFVPDNNYRGFLKRNVKNFEKRIQKGNFILEDGTIVGEHQGYPFYTIGQRKGLGIALGYPVYVTAIHPEKNCVVVGPFNELLQEGMYVGKLNMMKYSDIYNQKIDTITKVRYNDIGTPSVIEQTDDIMKVFFGKGVHAVTPGQAAVFYENDDVIGGGWIKKSFKHS